MSVYIALLDDDPADRKQSERLLSRERDERVENGDIIYYDSYGSEEAMLPYFMKYDLFLIDVTKTTRDGMMIAADLKNHGTEGRIVLYYDRIDYRKKYGDEEGISFIPKPLYQRDISRIVDMAKEVHDNKPPKIELRGDKGTLYVSREEIIYAVDRGYYMAIALTGDRSFHAMTDMVGLYETLDSPEFMITSKNTFINMNHVVSGGGTSFKMSDGAVIRFSILDKRAITKMYAEFAKGKK